MGTKVVNKRQRRTFSIRIPQALAVRAERIARSGGLSLASLAAQALVREVVRVERNEVRRVGVSVAAHAVAAVLKREATS